MSATQLQQIRIKDLVVSKTKSQTARRKRFDKVTLQELADSIKKNGVLQNIIARKNGKGLELVAGTSWLVSYGRILATERDERNPRSSDYCSPGPRRNQPRCTGRAAGRDVPVLPLEL